MGDFGIGVSRGVGGSEPLWMLRAASAASLKLLAFRLVTELVLAMDGVLLGNTRTDTGCNEVVGKIYSILIVSLGRGAAGGASEAAGSVLSISTLVGSSEPTLSFVEAEMLSIGDNASSSGAECGCSANVK